MPWDATSYQPMDATTGYILWTNINIGKAALWTVNPTTGTKTGGGPVSPEPGSPWEATSYFYVGSGGSGGALLPAAEKGETPVLRVRKAGAGKGTISTAEAVCGPECAELVFPYVEATFVTLQVIPDEDSAFVGWETETGSPLKGIYYAQPGETVIAVFEKK